jgi:hypothetical protein
MPTGLLTDIVAKSAKAIPDRQHTIWDSALPGFGLRIGSNVKAWTVMVGKDRRRIGDARLVTDRVGAEAAPRQQDDAGALGDLLRRLAIGNQPLQCRPITGPDVQASLDIPHSSLYTDLRD